MTYKVTWEIELEAASPLGAAQDAFFSITEGTARCFLVENKNGKCYDVDLDAGHNKVTPATIKQPITHE